MNRRNENILTPSKVDGFHVVGLRRNNRPKNYYVHRLVAGTFLGIDVNGIGVKHVNGNKDHNYLGNLRVVEEIRTVMRGRSGRRVYCPELGKTFESVLDAAEALGGAPTGIYAVLNGRNWTYRGFHFRYVNAAA